MAKQRRRSVDTKRTRLPPKSACDQCRRLKRKCDGKEPCFSCQKYNHACFYSNSTQGIDGIRPVGTSSSHCEVAIESNRSDPWRDSCEHRDMVAQATSGILSFHKLARREVPSNILKGFRAVAWNLGLPYNLNPRKHSCVAPINNLFLYEHVLFFSKVYFERIHPVYGFLSRDQFTYYLTKAYATRTEAEAKYVLDDRDAYTDDVTNTYEVQKFTPVICGVIALGSLFSRSDNSAFTSMSSVDRVQLEGIAFSKATDILLYPQIEDIASNDAGVYHVMGWALRILYLRAAASPQQAWLACCRTMNIVDLLLLHDEEKWSPFNHDRNQLRSLFWCLEILNTWLSLEIGRSKVQLSYIRCQYPEAADAHDATPVLVELYHRTKDVFSSSEGSQEHLISSLRQLINFKPSHPVLALERSHAAIILFRRMTLYNVGKESSGEIINMACDSLNCCRELSSLGLPWWNVVNVPFHLVSVLIVIDTLEFAPKMSEVLSTLMFVAEKFTTEGMKETIVTTKDLISLFKQRKEKELIELNANSAQLDLARIFKPSRETSIVTPLSESDIYPLTLDDLLAESFPETFRF